MRFAVEVTLGLGLRRPGKPALEEGDAEVEDNGHQCHEAQHGKGLGYGELVRVHDKYLSKSMAGRNDLGNDDSEHGVDGGQTQSGDDGWQGVWQFDQPEALSAVHRKGSTQEFDVIVDGSDPRGCIQQKDEEHDGYGDHDFWRRPEAEPEDEDRGQRGAR